MQANANTEFAKFSGDIWTASVCVLVGSEGGLGAFHLIFMQFMQFVSFLPNRFRFLHFRASAKRKMLETNQILRQYLSRSLIHILKISKQVLVIEYRLERILP